MPIYLSPQEITRHTTEIKHRKYIESQDVPLFFGYLMKNHPNPYFSQDDYEKIRSIRLKSIFFTNEELVSFIQLFPNITILSLVDLELTETDLKKIAEKCTLAFSFYFSQCPYLDVSSFKNAFGDFVEIAYGEYETPSNFSSSEDIGRFQHYQN
jgi:hypothetical protein